MELRGLVKCRVQDHVRPQEQLDPGLTQRPQDLVVDLTLPSSVLAPFTGRLANVGPPWPAARTSMLTLFFQCSPSSQLVSPKPQT